MNSHVGKDNAVTPKKTMLTQGIKGEPELDLTDGKRDGGKNRRGKMGEKKRELEGCGKIRRGSVWEGGKEAS